MPDEKLKRIAENLVREIPKLIPPDLIIEIAEWVIEQAESLEMAPLLEQAREAKARRTARIRPFLLACQTCDITSPETIEDAESAGWHEITYSPGPWGSHLGFCPSCW